MSFKMKYTIYILLFILVGIGYSCQEEERVAVFEDTLKSSIVDYLESKGDTFSYFLEILDKGSLKQTLSAYNPDGNGYTLFAPDNDADRKSVV